MLRKVANAATDPHHIKTGKADRESGHNVETPIPAMKRGKAIPDLRDQLKYSGENYDDRREKVHGDGEIAHGIARDVTMSYVLTPSMEIPPQRRQTKERRYRKRENRLADEDHEKPTTGCYFQGCVRNGIQVQPISQYGCAHNLSPYSSLLNRLCGPLRLTFPVGPLLPSLNVHAAAQDAASACLFLLTGLSDRRDPLQRYNKRLR